MLGRPQNLAVYASPDGADLAAAYAFGIARNHGFVDGNKRTAFVVALVFPLDHGYALTASDAEAVTVMVAVAGGDGRSRAGRMASPQHPGNRELTEFRSAVISTGDKASGRFDFRLPRLPPQGPSAMLFTTTP